MADLDESDLSYFTTEVNRLLQDNYLCAMTDQDHNMTDQECNSLSLNMTDINMTSQFDELIMSITEDTINMIDQSITMNTLIMLIKCNTINGLNTLNLIIAEDTLNMFITLIKCNIINRKSNLINIINRKSNQINPDKSNLDVALQMKDVNCESNPVTQMKDVNCDKPDKSRLDLNPDKSSLGCKSNRISLDLNPDKSSINLNPNQISLDLNYDNQIDSVNTIYNSLTVRLFNNQFYTVNLIRPYHDRSTQSDLFYKSGRSILFSRSNQLNISIMFYIMLSKQQDVLH
jgi:hypothetical protein